LGPEPCPDSGLPVDVAAGIQGRSVSDPVGLVVGAASCVVVFSEKKLKSRKSDKINDLRHSPVVICTVACAGLVPFQRNVAGVCVVREGVGRSGGRCSVGTLEDSSGLCNPRRSRVGCRNGC
jgi:hypothetical protein